LFLIFCGLHLWNSTHSLSLKNRTEKFEIKQDFGFYQPEKTGVRRDDFLGSWSKQGVCFLNSAISVWTKIASSASQIAAGRHKTAYG
jgi:uracil DNA glycosylase